MKISFRIKYFLSHLLISSLIAGASWFLIFKIWYPDPFHMALGIGGLVMMMLAIDVVLGPLLTLVLAKEGKKGLKLDLIVIGFVQLSALLYGLYSIDKGRPIVIAFDVNRFEIVSNHSIKNGEAKAVIRRYADAQNRNIPIVAVRPAKDEVEFSQRMTQELELGISSATNVELYQDIQQYFDIIQKESKPISELSKFNKDSVKLKQVLADYPQADRFGVVVGSNKNIAMLIDSKNKQVIQVVDLRPW